MDIRPIRTEDDHKWALDEIDRLWDSMPGTPDGDRLEVLAILVENYENKHHAIGLPHPISAIKHRLEMLGAPTSDLIPCIGDETMVEDILELRRHMTLEMIWKLSDHLDIPPRCSGPAI